MHLVQTAQKADDLARATAFYADLLGAEPTATYDPPGLVFFDLDGVRLLLDRGVPSALHYYAVEDIEATVARLRSGGAPVERAAPDLRPRGRHARPGGHRRVAGLHPRHRGKSGGTCRAAFTTLTPRHDTMPV